MAAKLDLEAEGIHVSDHDGIRVIEIGQPDLGQWGEDYPELSFNKAGMLGFVHNVYCPERDLCIAVAMCAAAAAIHAGARVLWISDGAFDDTDLSKTLSHYSVSAEQVARSWRTARNCPSLVDYSATHEFVSQHRDFRPDVMVFDTALPDDPGPIGHGIDMTLRDVSALYKSTVVLLEDRDVFVEANMLWKIEETDEGFRIQRGIPTNVPPKEPTSPKEVAA